MNRNCQLQQAEPKLKPIPEINRPESEGVDKLTLRELFDAEESRLLRYAFSLTGRRAVSEDIVQEVFLQLHSRWDEVEAPRAWLFRSVRNRAYNYNRDHQREMLTGADDEQHLDCSSAESPDASLLRREAVGELRSLLDELSEEDGNLLKLKYFEDLKYREISAHTGLSITNIGFRLHHILRGLAAKLRQIGVEELS